MNEQYRCKKCLKGIPQEEIDKFIEHSKNVTEDASISVYFCECGGFIEMKSNEESEWKVVGLKIEEENKK